MDQAGRLRVRCRTVQQRVVHARTDVVLDTCVAFGIDVLVEQQQHASLALFQRALRDQPIQQALPQPVQVARKIPHPVRKVLARRGRDHPQRIIQQRVIGGGADRGDGFVVDAEASAQGQFHHDRAGDAVVQADRSLGQHRAAFIVEGEQQEVGGEHGNSG